MKKDVAYRFLAPGFVLQSQEGKPQFFARTADQAFKLAMLHHRDPDSQHLLYDPFCGCGITLAAPLVFHRGRIRSLMGTDIDPSSVAIASANIALCAPDAAAARAKELREHPERTTGMQTPERLEEFAGMLRQYGCTTPVDATFFERNVLDPATRIADGSVDLVITDPPYGNKSPFADGGRNLRESSELREAYLRTLDSLRPSLRDDAVVVLICQERDELRELLSAIPAYVYRAMKRATGGAHGKNFRNLHVLSAG